MLDRPEPQPGGTGKNEFHEEMKNVKIPDYNWQRLLRFWFLFFCSDFSIINIYFKKRHENLPLLILYNLINSSFVDGKKMSNTHMHNIKKLTNQEKLIFLLSHSLVAKEVGTQWIELHSITGLLGVFNQCFLTQIRVTVLKRVSIHFPKQ